jgi:hypothetical protein
MPQERVVLKRILLIGTIVGIAMAHGVVLYKIDSGVRAADSKQETMASGTRRAAYW